MGIYEASMESAGKKMGSLERIAENAKVALGGAFQSALAAGIDTVTEHLKGMNEALERAKRNGEMEQWGNQIKGAMETAGGAVAGTTKLIWQNREAVMALGVAYGGLKTITTVAGVVGKIGDRWQSASTINHEAAVDKILKQSKADLALARRLNARAAVDEAIASERVAFAKIKEARRSYDITASTYKEATARHRNRMAMLEEARQQALSGNMKKSMIGSITSFIGPMGLATIAISAGAMAWSAYSRSLEKAREEQEKMRAQQREHLQGMSQAVLGIKAEDRALQESGISAKEKIEKQANLDKAIREAIREYPELLEAIKKEGGAYKFTREELDKLVLSCSPAGIYLG